MAVFDWHELAVDPAVRALAAHLREMLNLWVGFLDEDGVVVPIGDAEVVQSKPVCDRLKVNAVTDADGNSTSCIASIREWRDELAEAEDVDLLERRCHAGFRVFLRPLTFDDEFAGGLYASGFLAPEEEDRKESLRALLDENGLLEGWSDDEARARLDELAVVDSGDRKIVEDVLRRIAREVEKRLDAEELSHPEFLDSEPPRFEGMIGGTHRMTKLFEDLATVADSNSTVLIQGENGTGKELVARALHRRSRRSNHRFVALNCAAIPNQLVESELFGHKKGAFSGAHRDRKGLCVEAHQGTLFLDEIGDMDQSLQSKLLRFLQDGQFSPVGSSHSRSVDVRVICATNQDLETLVEAGEFRKDLYFRIRVIQLLVPPLRERRDDIPLLIDHFLSQSAKKHGRSRPELTEDCRHRLLSHGWPGNVRELENEIERLVIMSGGDDRIGVDKLSPRISGEPAVDRMPSFEEMTIPEATEKLERKMILDGLRETGWNKTQTAKLLGVSRRNLIRKVSQYELEEFRDES